MAHTRLRSVMFACCVGVLAVWGVAGLAGIAGGSTGVEATAERRVVTPSVAPIVAPPLVDEGRSLASDVDVKGSRAVVRCYSRGDGSPVEGVSVFLMSAESSDLTLVAETDSDGVARFAGVQDGSFCVSLRDPARCWTLVKSSHAPSMIVSIPTQSEVACEMAQVLVAQIKFVGDELLMVYSGKRSPGLSIARELASVDGPESWDPDGRLAPVAMKKVPNEYSYYYFSQEIEPPGFAPTVEVIAETLHHGECKFVVQLHPKSEGKESTILDLSECPAVDVSRVLFHVNDYWGNPTDVGYIQLRSHTNEAWPIELRANTEAALPSGFAYSARVGDFPVAWKTDKALNIEMAVAGQLISRSVTLQWPTTLIANGRITRDGLDVENGIMFCTVLGDFQGHGVGARSYPIRNGVLPPGAYPVGKTIFVVQRGECKWTVAADIRSGVQELIVNLQGPGK